MKFQGKPKMLLHVGRPDIEEPHHSMERCEKYHALYPDTRIVSIVWSEKDRDELLPKIDKEKAEIILWNDDASLMAWLLDHIPLLVGARIVWPQWFACTKGHITPVNYEARVEKCETCGDGVAHVDPLKDRWEAFAKLFADILMLTNFDTTSGQFLHAKVNPISNLLKNMPAAFGCEHAPAVTTLDLKDSWKGKPAIVCGAGPSLEDAIPHLKRLGDSVKVIAVGRAFKMLKAAGVRVDYTVTVEMFDWDAAIFSGITAAEAADTVMLYASVCAPATVKAWPGRKAALLDIETANLLGRSDYILGGNSVSHHMLNFAAQILNAEPIILCGIDLAYTKPRTHAEGTTPDSWPDEVKEKDKGYQAEEWVTCTGKGHDFHPECHKLMAEMAGGRFLPGQMIVRSSPAYTYFATLFSVLIGKHKKRVLNACPNGQKIGGAEYVDLASFTP